MGKISMSKDAYYFSHDSNARNDQRIMKIRMKYGMEGYGIYFGIIEILREQEDYILYETDIESVAYDLRTDKELVQDILFNHFLFEIRRDANIKEAFFFSKSLTRRMERMDVIREKRSIAGKISGIARSRDKQTLNTSSTKFNKERKVKEIKLKEIKSKDTINISFDNFWNLFDYKVGDKGKILKKWESLSDSDRDKVMEHLPLYVQSTPDKQFRKHPSTYLNNQGWFDEILNKSNGVTKFKLDSCGFPMAYCQECGVSASYREEELNGDSKCHNAKLLAAKP